jgi:hypothetical protein
MVGFRSLFQKPFLADSRHVDGWTGIMKARDLRVTFLLAAAWLLGLTMYSLSQGPTVASGEAGLLNLPAPLPVSTAALSAEGTSKHSKLPIRWAHQRWGAV